MKKLLILILCVPLILFGQNYQKGYDYYNSEKYELSIDYFTKAINKDPDNSSLYIVRGLSYKGLNLHKLAIKDYTKSIEIDDNIVSYNNRAYSYLQLRNYQLAILDYRFVLKKIDDLKKILERAPSILIDIHMNIGVCKMNLGLNYCENFHIACLLGDPEGCKLFNKYHLCKEDLKPVDSDDFSTAQMREYDFHDSIQIANSVSIDTILWRNQNEYINFSLKGFTETSTHKFTKKELVWYVDYYELNYKIIRNEIFARHGYIFKSGGEMDKYFRSKKWYIPKFNNINHLLSDIEKHNIQLIKQLEKSN